MIKAIQLRDQRQIEATKWAYRCFAPSEVRSIRQRGLRFLEEAIELAQACGVTKPMIAKLVVAVFDKPIGKIRQEIGGCGTTLLVLASAMCLSADECEAEEMARVLSYPPSYFTERNQAKNDLGLIVTELHTQNKLEEQQLASGEAMAAELQKVRDELARYKTKYGEL